MITCLWVIHTKTSLTPKKKQKQKKNIKTLKADPPAMKINIGNKHI